MASSNLMSKVAKSQEECSQWMQRVHSVQSKRSPEACEAARSRFEAARQHEVSSRKCKAVKGHAMRSRALVSEGLQQMSACKGPEEHMAVQARWKSAQDASYKHQEMRMEKASSAMVCSKSKKRSKAEVLRKAEDSEDEAMEEAAVLVGASDVRIMANVAAEMAPPPAAPGAGSKGRGKGGKGSTSTVDNLMNQLREEPEDEAECAAKFNLYEGYGSEVEQMRGTLLKFHEETRPTVPAVIATDMDKQVGGIDTAEAMGIPDDAREWFVYHMMRKAERNNLKMSGILDGFEKKLEFLASNDQSECPVCLEDFAAEGEHAPETLGCCHKVCTSCWDNWCSVMGGRAFCPLCRHEAFLGAVAARVTGAPVPPAESDSDDEE